MDVWVLDFHCRDDANGAGSNRTFSTEDAAKPALAEQRRYWRYEGAEELYGDHGVYNDDEVIRIYAIGGEMA
jgi:hypothetical protein